MPDASERDPLVATRRSLHAVAEQVLATALYRRTGRIGLRVAPGGFATPVLDGGDSWTQLEVDGVEIVVRSRDGEHRTRITTVAGAARAVGLDEPGMPADVYAPATSVRAAEPLTLHPAAAAELATALAVGDAALERLRAELVDDDPPIVQLWPEHLDAATTISQVNYGVSPGDDEHPLPYLYVGPWSPPATDGAFWNEPFGASRTIDATVSVETAHDFLREGRRRAIALGSA
ncbi:MAG TPA: hypothetical protein VIY72_10705 [Acidimicrobiales bacterium]